MSDVNQFVREQRVATAGRRRKFLEIARGGMLSPEILIEGLEAAFQLIDGLEAELLNTPIKKPQGRCQCVNCQGYQGWFAPCLGYRP